MTMILGTDEGFAEPSLPGQSNPFTLENLQAVPYRRLQKTRRAMLENVTYNVEPQVNDVIRGHRSVYTDRLTARNPRVLAAFHPGAAAAYTGGELPVAIRQATGTILEGTGKAVASPGDLVRTPMGAISSAAGLVSVNLGTGRSNEVAVAWLSANDQDGTSQKYLARVTDVNNWIGIHRQAAGNLRVERNVASAVATERDIPIPTSTPITGNAFGLRLSGTSASVFLNGVKVDEWTLNAAAQGLTGTLMGVLIGAGAFAYTLISYFEAWSLTPVAGV